MAVQPWGFFKVVSMEQDGAIESICFKHPDIKEYVEKKKDGYTDVDAKVQYAARNSINRTIWFWIVLVLSITIGLTKANIPLNIAISISVLLPLIRSLTLKKSLGLDKKPIVR